MSLLCQIKSNLHSQSNTHHHDRKGNSSLLQIHRGVLQIVVAGNVNINDAPLIYRAYYQVYEHSTKTRHYSHPKFWSSYFLLDGHAERVNQNCLKFYNLDK